MPINWILGHKPQHCHLICAMVYGFDEQRKFGFNQIF